MSTNTSQYVFPDTGVLSIGKQLWDHSGKMLILKREKRYFLRCDFSAALQTCYFLITQLNMFRGKVFPLK